MTNYSITKTRQRDESVTVEFIQRKKLYQFYMRHGFRDGWILQGYVAEHYRGQRFVPAHFRLIPRRRMGAQLYATSKQLEELHRAT